MRVAVIGANLGGFDNPVPHHFQIEEVELHEVAYHLFTDANMTPRPKAMTSRLQAKIPKMFGWQLRPGYDAYIWCDASLRLSRPDSVQWFLDQLGSHDIAVFKHPWRKSAREEAEFLKMKLASGSRYIRDRYEGEDIDGQMAFISAGSFVDNQLYAAGAFCYRDTEALTDAMVQWWHHTTRYHCIDQLSFPFALWVAGADVTVINEDIFHASHVEWTRARGHG